MAGNAPTASSGNAASGESAYAHGSVGQLTHGKSDRDTLAAMSAAGRRGHAAPSEGTGCLAW